MVNFRGWRTNTEYPPPTPEPELAVEPVIPAPRVASVEIILPKPKAPSTYPWATDTHVLSSPVGTDDDKAAREVYVFRASEPSVAYAESFIMAALSHCRFRGVDVGEDGDLLGPTKNRTARQIIRDFFGHAGRQAEALRKIGQHLFLTGACYIVHRIGVQGVEVYSAAQLKPWGNDGAYQLELGLGRRRELNPSEFHVIRIFRGRPDADWLPDSPCRNALATLSVLRMLTNYLILNCGARFTAAGLLLLPQEMDFPAAAED